MNKTVNKINEPIFMAFASGSESREVVRKLYKGVGPVFVLGVNPNKAETKKFFNIELDEEPNYIGEAEVGPEGNKQKVAQARIDFVIRTDSKKCNGIDIITRIGFSINKAFRYNKDNTKVQVIDKYGRTAWATIEEAKNKIIPTYSNGNKANIDADYRPAYIGEEALTMFIKNYLNIPNVEKWKDKKVVGLIDHPEQAEARLDKIESYFKNDFTEVRKIIQLQPQNRVKVMFGVRTNDEGKQYQAVYNQMTLKLGVTDYSKLDEDLQNRLANGAYANTEFGVEDIHEYNVEATNFNNSENNPFSTEGAPSSNPWDGWK